MYVNNKARDIQRLYCICTALRLGNMDNFEVRMTKVTFAFHSCFQHCIISVHWYDFITNDEVTSLTSHPDILNTIAWQQYALFRHLQLYTIRFSQISQYCILSASTWWISRWHMDGHLVDLATPGWNNLKRTLHLLQTCFGTWHLNLWNGQLYNPQLVLEKVWRRMSVKCESMA